jgi:hypothetical protein
MKKKDLQRIAQKAFEENLMKFNFKCDWEEFVPGTFKCGDTPEEAKANYEKKHGITPGSKVKQSVPKSPKAEAKEVTKAVSPKVTEARSIIEKIKAEKAQGKVSAESYRALKSAIGSLKSEKTEIAKPVTFSKVGVKDFGTGEIDVSNYAGDIKDISHDDLMKQASSSDIYARMDKNLTEISDRKVTYHDVSGKMNKKAIENINNNAKIEVSQYASYLAGDTANLMRDHIDNLSNIIKDKAFKDVDAKDMNALVIDSVQKLIHQEVESDRQQFSDHGIRHIMGDIERQGEFLKAFKGGKEVGAREKLMSIVTMINHDVGYTTPLVRAGGERAVGATHSHEEMGAKILGEQKKLWNEGKIFTGEEFDKIVDTVKSHSSTKIDIKDPFATSARLADNLALFQKDKLPSMFKYVDGSKDLLVKMKTAIDSDNKEEFNNLQKELVKRIDGSRRLSDNMKMNLIEASKKIDKFTLKNSIGTLAGEIESITGKKGSKIQVDIQYNDFDKEMQDIFDMGQRQTKKFLEDYGIKDFDKDEYDLGGMVTLKVHREQDAKNAIDMQYSTSQLDKDAIEGGKQFAAQVKNMKEKDITLDLGNGMYEKEKLVSIEYKNGVKINVPKGSEDVAHQAMYKISRLPGFTQKKVPEISVFSVANRRDAETSKKYGQDFKSHATHFSGNMLQKPKIVFWSGSDIDAHTIAHELTHEFDNNYSKSNSQEYKSAVQKDGGEYVSDYARHSAVIYDGKKDQYAEDIADAVASYSIDPVGFEKKYPNRAAYFKGIK